MRKLGRIQRHAAAQLAREVGVGDPVADQPAAQLGKVGVALALGAQHADQIRGQPWGDADLGGQRGGVDLVAAVDLALQPGVGHALPRQPRVRRRLNGWRRGRRMLSGPEAGLEIVDRLCLEDYHYLHATRGELLWRLGHTQEARKAYRRALTLVHDDAERRLLARRLAELDSAAGPRNKPGGSVPNSDEGVET